MAGGVTVYDDFAHHPTAIRTTVDGLRRQLNANAAGQSEGQRPRLIAVFEPRSSTMKQGAMKAQLPWALEEADLSFCFSGGLDWDAAQALAPLGTRACAVADLAELVARVAAVAMRGDHLLCMSNGGFGGVHHKLLEALRQKFAPSSQVPLG